MLTFGSCVVRTYSFTIISRKHNTIDPSSALAILASVTLTALSTTDRSITVHVLAETGNCKSEGGHYLEYHYMFTCILPNHVHVCRQSLMPYLFYCQLVEI